MVLDRILVNNVGTWPLSCRDRNHLGEAKTVNLFDITRGKYWGSRSYQVGMDVRYSDAPIKKEEAEEEAEKNSIENRGGAIIHPLPDFRLSFGRQAGTNLPTVSPSSHQYLQEEGEKSLKKTRAGT